MATECKIIASFLVLKFHPDAQCWDTHALDPYGSG